jgi:hypothetical protein
VVVDQPRDGLLVALVTATGANPVLYQDIPIPPAMRVVGTLATLSVDVKLISGAGGTVVLAPVDGSGTWQGTAVSGSITSGSWTTMILRPTVLGASATALRMSIVPDSASTTGVVHAARPAVYFGATPWPFEAHPQDRPFRYVDFTTHQMDSATTTDLATVTIPAGVMTDYQHLRIRAGGTCTGTNGNKTIGLLVGGVTLTAMEQTSAQAEKWSIVIDIYRLSATSIRYWYRAGHVSAVDYEPFDFATVGSFDAASDVIVRGTLAHNDDAMALLALTVEVCES